jgi:hypothetical protein
MSSGVERNYDVNGAVSIRIVGDDPVSEILDRTLGYFRGPPKNPDLTLVLGEYPSKDWIPEGTMVGDRFLYDAKSETTAVLNGRIEGGPSKSGVEYVMTGDLRTAGGNVTVYVPNLRKPTTSARGFYTELGRRHPRRALLAVAGNPLAMRQVARQAEEITEAVIEPFLYYRLPSKGLCLAHATSFSSGEVATLYAGSANIGKTTLALGFVREKRVFLGDTLVILSDQGDVLPYPGLVKLHGGHLTLFPELGGRLAERLGRFGSSLFKGELTAHPQGVLDALPQRQMTELFEAVTIPKRCTLGSVFLVSRGTFRESANLEVDSETAAKSLTTDIVWEFETAPWRKGQFIYSSDAVEGADFLHRSIEHRARILGVMLKGVSRSRCYRLQLPMSAPVTLAADFIPALRS